MNLLKTNEQYNAENELLTKSFIVLLNPCADAIVGGGALVFRVGGGGALTGETGGGDRWRQYLYSNLRLCLV